MKYTKKRREKTILYNHQTKKISSGRCECFYAPAGSSGLEGFNRGCEYNFEEMKKLHTYFRVYSGGKLSAGEYETCGPIEFKKYFKIKK